MVGGIACISVLVASLCAEHFPVELDVLATVLAEKEVIIDAVQVGVSQIF